MPRADFRLKGDRLDPLAPVKALAVMCHPVDARGREAILRRPVATITVPRHQDVPEHFDDVLPHELWAEFREHRRLGALAGALTLSLAQLSAFGRSGEKGTVLALASTLAAEWEEATWPEAPDQPSLGVPSQSEGEIVEAFETYRSVSHLWAALVYGKIKKRADIRPVSCETLPTFLAHAEEIARLATTLRWLSPDPVLELTAGALWSFVLPADLTRHDEIGGLQAPIGRAPVHEALRRGDQFE